MMTPPLQARSAPEYRVYRVQPRSKKPLLDFMCNALESAGCKLLYKPAPDEAPFRFVFETPEGERMGVVAYAFHANSELTKNRPPDEHRFQIKYGNNDKKLHPIWTDPYSLYTTLFVGIDPERKIFVGADPVLHDQTPFFISLEFKRAHVNDILARDWYSWERSHRAGDNKPVEVLVGGTAKSFLQYIRFEREAYGEDPGHRQLLAERFLLTKGRRGLTIPTSAGPVPPPDRLHALAKEFQMGESEVLDMIAKARMLKMAVRGWVAEEHLLRKLAKVRGVSGCQKSTVGADVQLRYRNRPLRVECKNVLRETTKSGLVRIDLQRTRTSKGDKCSRFYSPKDFEVVAGCLHAVTLKWEFKFAASSMLDPHPSCVGKLVNNVKLDERWTESAASAFDVAVGTF